MKKGFTLIELLIVVAIIGILAAIAVPNFLNAQVRAKVAKAVSNMRGIQSALEMYFLDHNSYPTWAWDASNIANHYRGYRSLTTPVSYVNGESIFYNPFKSDTQTRTHLADGRELDPMFEMGTWFSQSGQNYAIQMPSNVYLLESSGPDSGDDYDASTFPSPGRIYQPSNGIYSRGDIFRAGGAKVPSWAAALTY